MQKLFSHNVSGLGMTHGWHANNAPELLSAQLKKKEDWTGNEKVTLK